MGSVTSTHLRPLMDSKTSAVVAQQDWSPVLSATGLGPWFRPGEMVWNEALVGRSVEMHAWIRHKHVHRI
jgi:hypothetical protein